MPTTGTWRRRGASRWHRDARITAFGLFGRDAGILDDRPPLLDLGPLMLAERLGRLLFARQDVLPEVGEALAHDVVRNRFHHRTIESRDHARRRAARRPQRVP